MSELTRWMIPAEWIYCETKRKKKKVRFEVRDERRYKSLVLSSSFWDGWFYIQKRLMSHYIFRSNRGMMHFKTSLFWLIQSWIVQERWPWRLDSSIKDSTCSDSFVQSFLPIWNSFLSYLDVHADWLVSWWGLWLRELYGWLLADVNPLSTLSTLDVGICTLGQVSGQDTHFQSRDLKQSFNGYVGSLLFYVKH